MRNQGALGGGIPTQVKEALLTARDSSEALNRLYQSYRHFDASYSLPSICRRSGVKSSGYLSDVLHGKRRLNAKYDAGIIKAFGLSGTAASYLRLLLAIDREDDEAKLKRLQKRLELHKKVLSQVTVKPSGPAEDFNFALEVFCAFGLFKNRPTRQDLKSYFVDHSERAIADALLRLETMGVVGSENDALYLKQENINVSEDADFNVEEFLKSSLKRTVQVLPKWFPQRELALFESVNLSVRREDLTRILAELREKLALVRADLESQDADMLVQFNVQLYPLQ